MHNQTIIYYMFTSVKLLNPIVLLYGLLTTLRN